MRSLLAMFRYEWKRLLTPGRMFWWFAVTVFPVAIILLMQTYGPIADVDQWKRILSSMENRPVDDAEAQQHVDTLLTICLYFLAPSIACMLGSLLTAAPAVASELEQHSWIYLATRPNGLFHLIIGKYLVAVMWAATAAWAGILLALPLAHIHGKFEAGWTLLVIALLSAMAYSALFLMIGTIFHLRAMVFCVAYTAGVEVFLGFFPAVINRFTIQYRLRSLLFQWTTQREEFRDSKIVEFVDASGGWFLQVMWLISLTAVFLAVSLVTVQVREFTVAVESES